MDEGDLIVPEPVQFSDYLIVGGEAGQSSSCLDIHGRKITLNRLQGNGDSVAVCVLNIAHHVLPIPSNTHECRQYEAIASVVCMWYYLTTVLRY